MNSAGLALRTGKETPLCTTGGGCSNIIPYQLMLKTQCHKPTMTWDGLQHHFMVILGIV